MRRRRHAAALPLTGTISVPGDKSISHRALILAALADGASRVAGLNSGDDVRATADALVALGAAVDLDPEISEARVEGKGWTGLHEPADVIDTRNSGTTMRTLAGVCAAVPGLSIFTGDATLRRRPMLRIVAPLRQMGAAVDGAAHGDRPPLIVRGGALTGIDLELPAPSAQVKTCVLLAGLRASGETSVTEPGRSRDHTERMLAAAGVQVQSDAGTTSLPGGQAPVAIDWDVPGDFSSAAFFIVAATLVAGSDLTIERVGLNPSRTGLLDVLRAMGAAIETTVTSESGGEPVGIVHVTHSELHGTTVDRAKLPTMLDEVPVLAIAASQAEGETVIAGAGELRVKEADRIATMVEGLRALGADAEELPDGLVVRGSSTLTGGGVNARGDHRAAMSFAVAGLVSDGNVRVEGWSSVETSFPEFLDVLGSAQGRLARP
jgi:3-phosphoshikimate 1-carboxyvinyltransferase